MQKTDGEYVYFYPHYNFINSSREYGWEFSDEDMYAFKEANSWNREMSDSSKFLRVRISRRKDRLGPLAVERIIEIHDEIFPDENLNRGQTLNSMVFLRSDNYGRSAYQVDVRIGYNPRAIIVQADHTFDIHTGMLEITDINRYQTDLRLLMERNGWNQP